METQFKALTPGDMLAGKRVFNVNPQTSLAWVPLVREGFPVACATEFAEYLRLSIPQLSRTLSFTPSALGKRKEYGLLTMEQSVRLLRHAKIVESAAAVFEGLEPAMDWLNHPNVAMGHVTPVSLLDTGLGAEEVRTMLGRIAHGIPS